MTDNSHISWSAQVLPGSEYSWLRILIWLPAASPSVLAMPVMIQAGLAIGALMRTLLPSIASDLVPNRTRIFTSTEIAVQSMAASLKSSVVSMGTLRTSLIL